MTTAHEQTDLERRATRVGRAVALALAVCSLAMLSASARVRAQSAEVDDSPPDSDADAVQATLALGIGVTQRLVEMPSVNGPRRLETTFVPALDLRMAARVHGERFYVGAGLGYQSSIGAEGVQMPIDPDAAGIATKVRTHRLEVGVLPGLRFGRGPGGVSLGLFAGWGLRTFDTVVELPMPRYTLHGPLARLEFEAELASGLLGLRAAPEAQWIVSLSRDLREAGSVQDSGFALGIELSARLRMVEWAAMQLLYRESHAIADTALEGSFEDVERYVLLGAVFRYF